MVLDGAGTDEELRADLGIRVALCCKLSDLCLLRGELAAGVYCPFACVLTGRAKLASCALGERFGAHGGEHVMGGAQLAPRVESAALPPQPFAVEEMGTGESPANACAAKVVDRLAVELFGGLAVAQQCSRAGLDSDRP